MKVGLTGGIGSGKSEVSARLANLGAVVIDADAVAREVVEPGSPGLGQVVAEFGPGVLGPDGLLDRPRLGEIVFADKDRLARLNGILHPLIAERMAAVERAAAPDAVVVHDVPLIAENGLRRNYDLVVVVDAPPEVQLARLTSQRGMTADAARDRMRAQASREQRLAVADLVVDNSGPLDDLDAAVRKLWRELRARQNCHT